MKSRQQPPWLPAKQGWLMAIALGFAVGCGSEGASAPDDESGWEELAGGDWTLPAGSEGYRCLRTTLTEDVVIGAFKPLEPPGTHHTTLSLGPPNAPDGIEACEGGAGLTSARGLWASGVNSGPFQLPDGVAMVARAGEQLLLTLHLFNATRQTLAGRSGVAVQRRLASEMVYEAEGTLMGPVAIALPPGKTTRIVGGCTFAQSGTVFGFIPHMHRLGRHMLVAVERAGQPDQVLYDGAYSFEEQSFVAIPEVRLDAGNRLRVECTYDNHTKEEVGFGESTLDEMCFAATAHYPPSAQIVCFQ
jgi:hypothetical protein